MPERVRGAAIRRLCMPLSASSQTRMVPAKAAQSRAATLLIAYILWLLRYLLPADVVWAIEDHIILPARAPNDPLYK